MVSKGKRVNGGFTLNKNQPRQQSQPQLEQSNESLKNIEQAFHISRKKSVAKQGKSTRYDFVEVTNEHES